uniref:UDP-glucuronate 4-epimerase 6 n=1 Tax=Aegilops tauschii TaxID=37682 RepID=N1R4D6_AEGTA
MPHPSSSSFSSASVDAAAQGVKLERYASGGGALLMRRAGSSKIVAASSHLLFRAAVLATLALVCLFAVHYPSLLSRSFRLSAAASSSSPPRQTSRHRNPARVVVGHRRRRIDDVVKGCLGALDTAGKSTGSKSGKKRGPAPLRVYNLGNTSPVAVTRMVAILEKLLGKKANKRVVTMPSNGDVPFTHANVSHAARDFGYHPTTSLDAGLRKFVEWFLQYYKIDPAKLAKGSRVGTKTTKKKSMGAKSAAS